jgi:HD-GYP domain-containing protein (c-di-GMP phosphodiesterase class II)
MGEHIPLYARLALLSQVVDMFFTASGPAEAREEVLRRRGGWFDPELVDSFLTLSEQDAFWQTLRDPDLGSQVLALEPAQCCVPLDEDYLDEIAAAFGQIVDAKSPYTAGHSARVALYADHIATQLDFAPERRRWLYRGALLHDVGKLGVSNAVLDKAGKLDAAEWEAVQMHATYTERILGRISAFSELARVSGAHHERLDGTGYPRRLTAERIALETRIITTADIFDAISADRPYRGAVPIPETLQIMSKTVGAALDPQCFEALRRAVDLLEHPIPEPMALAA